MARTILLAEVKQAEVARITQDEVEQQGALVDEHTHARTVFEGIEVEGGLRRGGYVGTYQAVGDKDVEVRVEAWATGPRRFFWATVGIEFLVVLGLLVASPPSNVWFLAGMVLWAWFAVAALLYFLSFRGSQEVEAGLARALEARFGREGLQVLDEEALIERDVRLRLEGELKERELAQRTGGSGRFGRGRTGAREHAREQRAERAAEREARARSREQARAKAKAQAAAKAEARAKARAKARDQPRGKARPARKGKGRAGPPERDG